MSDIKCETFTLGALLRAAAERHGARTFLEFPDGTVTFADANGLAALDAAKDSKIAIMAMNGLGFIDAWLGAARTGAVYVPINTDYKGDILRYQLGKADVSHMVIDPAFLERLDAVAADLPRLRYVILTAPMAGAPPTLGNGVAITTLADVMSAPDHDPGIEIAPSDPLAISFTSGTTGPSKGVLASHAHVITFARDWIMSTDYGEGQSIYTCMPLFQCRAGDHQWRPHRDRAPLLGFRILGRCAQIQGRCRARHLLDGADPAEATAAP